MLSSKDCKRHPFQFRVKMKFKMSPLFQLMVMNISEEFSQVFSINLDITELSLFKMEKLSRQRLNTLRVSSGIEVIFLHTSSLTPRLQRLSTKTHSSFWPIKKSAMSNKFLSSWNMPVKTRDN